MRENIYQHWQDGTERQRDLICMYQQMPPDLQAQVLKDGTEWQRDLICAYQQMPDKKDAINRATAYAAAYGLVINNGELLAFRNHDKWGRGQYYHNRYYRRGEIYTDWHCDPQPDVEDSFGLGIWPKGNTPVAVPLEKFVIAVNRQNGKARVLEFRVL